MTGTTTTPEPPQGDVTRLRDLSPVQVRSGFAAWLGWLFDGLDGYLYILVSLPLVAQLMHSTPENPEVLKHASYIQAAFLVGWAVGGAVFGRIGDRLGRSRTISLTILTYALCTGLSKFAWSWESLMALRFLAALGIGGEWAAGSSLIAETWPRAWRPWASAALQSAYQVGILLATATLALLAASDKTWVFAVGALPALLTFWIRKQIPEPEEWTRENQRAKKSAPSVLDLLRPPVLRITILTVLVCSIALTTVWAFIFWFTQHLRKLPDVSAMLPAQQSRYIASVTAITMVAAIFGNFFAAWMARRAGYRMATVVMFLGGMISLLATYMVPHDHVAIIYYLSVAHFFVQGVFGLFPLYIPPLFPTLLRTTGAGVCYNIGRLVAALGTVYYGIQAPLKDLHGISGALVMLSYLYIPGILIALFMPEPAKEDDVPPSVSRPHNYISF